MSIISLLANDNFIVVNKDLIKLLGLDAAVLLGELAEEYNYWLKKGQLDADGCFYSTVENVENNTSLSQYKQSEALNKLKSFGVVEITRKGIPAKRYIKIFDSKLLELFDYKISKNLITVGQKIEEQELEEFDVNNNKDNSNKKRNKNSIYESEFEEIWKKYPKKAGKEMAKKSYINARKDKVEKEMIEAGLDRYIEYLKVMETEDRYIKNGSTWFNQRCWNDEYKASKRVQNPINEMQRHDWDYEQLERLAAESLYRQ